MALFLVQCRDVAGGAEIRTKNRDDHLVHVRGSGRVRVAGAVLDDAGDITGSWLVIETSNRVDAEAWCAADPFSAAGVYAETTVTPVRMSHIDIKPEGV